jgi:hypothetical protein
MNQNLTYFLESMRGLMQLPVDEDAIDKAVSLYVHNGHGEWSNGTNYTVIDGELREVVDEPLPESKPIVTLLDAVDKYLGPSWELVARVDDYLYYCKDNDESRIVEVQNNVSDAASLALRIDNVYKYKHRVELSRILEEPNVVDLRNKKTMKQESTFTPCGVLKFLGPNWSMGHQTDTHYWFANTSGYCRVPVNIECGVGPMAVANFIKRWEKHWIGPVSLEESINLLDKRLKEEEKGIASSPTPEGFLDAIEEPAPKEISVELNNFLAEVQAHGPCSSTSVEQLSDNLCSLLRMDDCPDFEYIHTEEDMRESVIQQMSCMSSAEIVDTIITPLFKHWRETHD